MIPRHWHPSDRDLLLTLDGELSLARRQVIESHLLSCEHCRERTAEVEATLSNAAIPTWGDDAASRDSHQRARLATALDRAAEEWTCSWTVRFRTAVAASRPILTAGLAATLVVVTAIALRSSVGSGAVDHLTPSERGALPVASLTPGAVAPIAVADLCAGVRPTRAVTADVRDRVLHAYGMSGLSEASYELDALVTPELGGSTDARNLWPQRYESPIWNARVKDELEHLLPRLVCEGRVDLAVAQRDIATNWIAAYKKYFDTDVPLQAHRGPAVEDDDDLEILPAVYVTAARR